MKSILTTCITIFAASILFAAQPKNDDEFRCRNNYSKIDASLSVEDQLTLDLINGLWVNVNEDNFIQESYHFHPSGEVIQLSQTPEKHFNNQVLSWELQHQESSIELVLTDQFGNNQTYEIAPNCEGILLSEDNSSTIFKHQNTLDDKILDDKKQALIGEWENILTKVELEALGNPEIPKVSLQGVRVQITFQANGNFNKAIVTAEGVSFEEKGKWDISKDGEYILLHCADNDQPMTQAVKIKHLELDELVLEQPLAIIGKSYSTTNKYFFFNKI